MTETNAARELGSFRAMFFLSVGKIGWGVKDAGITGLLLLFYSQVIGVPAHLVGLAIGAALVFDAVIDPVIGILSDNSTSRWGRRLPFMYASAIPVGFIYFFLWQPSEHWSHTSQFIYLLVLAVLVRAFIAMFEIPSTALVPELTSDYHKRTQFLNWQFLMGILGALLIGFVALRYILVPDKLHPIGQLNPAGYPKYALLASVVMTLSILISCFGLHRYIPYFVKTEPRYASVGQFTREIWQTLTLPLFRVLVISGLFSSAAAGLGGALTNVMLTYFWKLDNKQISLFSLAGGIALIFAFAVLVPATRFFEKRVVAILGSVISIVLGTLPYVAALFGWMPDIAHQPWMLYVLLGWFIILAAIAVVAVIVVSSMMADVVEYGAIQTGRRTEGTFFAATSLTNKASSGIGIFLGGMIQSYARIPPHALPNSLDPSVMHRLFVVLVPVTILLHIGAITFFLRYRISRADHEANVRQLKEREASLVLVPDPGTADFDVALVDLTVPASSVGTPPG